MKLRRMSETLRSARPIDRHTKARSRALASHRGWHRNRLGAGTDGERTTPTYGWQRSHSSEATSTP